MKVYTGKMGQIQRIRIGSKISDSLIIYYLLNKKHYESEEKILCALSFCVCSVLIIAQNKRTSRPKKNFGHSFVLPTSSTSQKSLMATSCTIVMLTISLVIIFLFSHRKKNQSETISKISSVFTSCLQQEGI